MREHPGDGVVTTAQTNVDHDIPALRMLRLPVGSGCSSVASGHGRRQRAATAQPIHQTGRRIPLRATRCELASRLNRLRAGVLGANDGIVSVAGIVTGVAGATAARGAILTAGIAGLVAGAVSMALGEYVSVSSQRDSQRALLEQERVELAAIPDQELDELTALYRAKGLSSKPPAPSRRS